MGCVTSNGPIVLPHDAWTMWCCVVSWSREPWGVRRCWMRFTQHSHKLAFLIPIHVGQGLSMSPISVYINLDPTISSMRKCSEVSWKKWVSYIHSYICKWTLEITELSKKKGKGVIHGRYGSVRIKSLKVRIQTMSFPTYINFQVNNTGGGRSNMVVHSHAVILMLLSLFPESFGIFFSVSSQEQLPPMSKPSHNPNMTGRLIDRLGLACVVTTCSLWVSFWGKSCSLVSSLLCGIPGSVGHSWAAGLFVFTMRGLRMRLWRVVRYPRTVLIL